MSTMNISLPESLKQFVDKQVAERGYAFMSKALTPQNRGQVFKPEVEAPADADPYDRIAAFAGREV